MPTYVYLCECGHETEEFRRIADRDNAPEHCGGPMARQIAPTYGFVIGAAYNYKTVAADKETGKQEHITSKKQHEDFLKRNNYEPTA